MPVVEQEAGTSASGSMLRVVALSMITVSVAFGLLALEHAVALSNGRLDLFTRALGWLTSDAFVFGPGSLRYVIASYEAAAWRMPVHILLGGVAIVLGCLQFIPRLRRSHPRLHRLSGFVIWLAVFASMFGAIAYLWFVPMGKSASGAAFYLGLWALAFLTLGLLWQAMLAVWSRDFRSHMVWMALLFAALATAPMLRLDWIVFARAWPYRGHEMVNLGTGMFVLMQTLLLMCLWLSTIGDRDLPGRKNERSIWPTWLVVALCVLSSVGAVQEGVLPLAGFDVFASSRTAGDAMPSVAVLWAAATVAAMILLPREWRRGLEGARPSSLVSVAAVGVALGALFTGIQYDTGTLARFATSVFWGAYGIFVLTVLGLAHIVGPNSLGRNAWGLIMLSVLWLPSQIGFLVFLNLQLGVSFSEAMTAALVNGVGGIICGGLRRALEATS